MPNINSLEIDTSTMGSVETSRQFTVNGEIGAKFTLIAIQDNTAKFYDFETQTFEDGHSNNSNLTVEMNSTVYNGAITFPASTAATFTIKLLTVGDTEVNDINRFAISKSITKLYSNATVTFTLGATAADNYTTFPTVTTTGGIFDSNLVTVDLTATNVSNDSYGFGLRLTDTSDISDGYFYFQETEAVVDNPAGDGADSNIVTVASVANIGVGMILTYYKASTAPENNAGSAVGTTTVIAIDTDAKSITFSQVVGFDEGQTMTFRAYGSSAINTATGVLMSFPTVEISTPNSPLYKTVRTTSSSSTTINLIGTYGVAGGNHVHIKGPDVDNSSSSRVTSVSASSTAGSIVVESAQSLTAGVKLGFSGVHASVNFLGSILLQNYPQSNMTIYLDLDNIITVGAAS